MVSHSFYLIHALPVFFIKYCHKLSFGLYTKSNGGSMKACQYLMYGKYVEKEFFHSLSILILHYTKLENFVMLLKRQSVEAWQNEKHYSEENNTSENPISRREIFKSVDYMKYEGQVRSQHLLFVQFSR